MWQGVGNRLGRWRYRHRAAAELTACWHATPPAPRGGQAFLAVDLETTSLSAAEGEVVSMAWVAIDHAEIAMASACHLLVAGSQSVGRSAEIHQLRDCERSEGLPANAVMKALLTAAVGRILIFHHARLDCDYLDRLSLHCFDSPLYLPHLDTMERERQRLLRRDQPLSEGTLRLATCRRRYGLPDYPAHNAFNDALATAELFLAQCAR